MGGIGNPDINKAFTRRCVLDASNLANSSSKSGTLSTVDAPGVIISPYGDLVSTDCILFSGTKAGLYRSLYGSSIFISAWALTLSVRL